MANIAYLLLGTNLGDKAQNLHKATQLLSGQAGQIIKSSAIYETLPWGVSNQPPYWNQVLQLQTQLSPQDVLTVIHTIEKELGRERRIRWESRLIDIDIIYFNNLVLETESLTIPHPQLANRRFVLVPLTEIAPDFVHPLLQLSNQQLLDACPDNLLVTKLS